MEVCTTLISCFIHCQENQGYRLTNHFFAIDLIKPPGVYFTLLGYLVVLPNFANITTYFGFVATGPKLLVACSILSYIIATSCISYIN